MAIVFQLIRNRIKAKRKITKVNLETLSEIADILNCDIADFISMSNLHSNDDFKDKFFILYNQLNIEEREILYQLLLTYIAKSSK